MDGTCSISIPLIEQQLTGSMYVGQLKVNWINLPAGEYKLVHKRSLDELAPVFDERMGIINVTNIATDGNYTMYLKGPRDESFYKIR